MRNETDRVGTSFSDQEPVPGGRETIANVRLFDGVNVVDNATVIVEDGLIASVTVGERSPAAGAGLQIDGSGYTLIPGLIDSHVHAQSDVELLRGALRFGVTTVLEMNGHWKAAERRKIAENDELADLRSAGFAVGAPGGHPGFMFPPDDHYPGIGDTDEGGVVFEAANATNAIEAVRVVRNLVTTGSDYIKVAIEDGEPMGAPGLPVIDAATVAAVVREGHRHGKIVVAHALSARHARTAIKAGVDGLNHVFIDRVASDDDVRAISESGAFVSPCLVMNRAIIGHAAPHQQLEDAHSQLLTPNEAGRVGTSFEWFPQGVWADVVRSVGLLHAAGVEILAGTDANAMTPVPGVSLHQELRLLVGAGLSPVEALRAATSAPASRFALVDRGRVKEGFRADLLLIEGDPMTRIEDSLSIRAIWRRGRRTSQGAPLQAEKRA
jgi:imidazolonepropionase-like amidohydrolase